MGGRGGQGGFERRIEVFVKIQKKIKNYGGGSEGGGGGQVGGRLGGGGVRVEVNEELKFLGKFKKKKLGGVVGGSGCRGGQGG